MKYKVVSKEEAEAEKRLRIKVLLAAFSYEIMDDPIWDDATFDRMVRKVDTRIRTGREDLDDWFVKNFYPPTGSWIHTFPELNKLLPLYRVVRETLTTLERKHLKEP